MRLTPAIVTVASALAMLVLLMITMGRMLPRSSRFGALVLTPALSSASGYTSAETHSEYLGRAGMTLTPLRPSGAMALGEKREGVITAGEFIEKGVEVTVVDVCGHRGEVAGRSVIRDAPQWNCGFPYCSLLRGFPLRRGVRVPRFCRETTKPARVSP